MATKHCPNCGIAISETPEKDGLHPVQMETPVENGERYCEACAFRAPDHGEYEHDGETIVRAAGVDLDDEELAELLADTMQAQELRTFMSARGLTRSRGANKAESAKQAVAQDRTLIAAAMDAAHSLTETGEYSAMCSCGFEEFYGGGDAAEEAAKQHKSENTDHFPKAWGPNGERIYG